MSDKIKKEVKEKEVEKVETIVPTVEEAKKRDELFLDLSKSRKNLPHIIASLQYILRNIKKDAKAFNYKYLTLPTLVEYIYEKSGIMGAAFTYNMSLVDSSTGEYRMDVIIIHIETLKEMSSSFFMKVRESDIPLNSKGIKSMNFPQWYGSCASYMRRYALLNLLGIAPDDDDDAGGKYRTE